MKKFRLSIVLLLCISANVSAQWSTEVFSMRGRQALSDGQYTRAIENFNILAQLDSTDYWCFFFRGIAKFNLGDLRGARKDFDNCVRLNPVFTNGYHYRAITESRSGEYEKALDDLAEAIRLRPGDNGVYFSRGVTYFMAQRFDEAVEDFNHYIRKEPKDPSAYLNRGACHLFLGDTTRAVNDYDRAIRLDRNEPDGYIRRARVHAARKHNDLAIEDLGRAIEIDPDNTFAYFNRALIQYDCRNYNEAVSDLDEVLRREPGNALTLYNRSLIYAQVGEYEKALSDIDRVININPGNVLARYNRACIFTEMERWLDALDDYDKAIELFPDFAKAYLNRSYVKLQLGRTASSKSDYETAQRKIREYREGGAGSMALADTSQIYNTLLALDADFARKDFDDELLQHRDVDIKLRPLYKFTLSDRRPELNLAFSKRYRNVLLDKFIGESATPIQLGNGGETGKADYMALVAQSPQAYFIRALDELQNKQFNSAIEWMDKAIEAAESAGERDRYERYYKAFYLLNRGVLKAEMIDFIASLEGSVQTLQIEEGHTNRARVSEIYTRSSDYSEAIADIEAASDILKDIPQIHFDLGNLYCLSANMVKAIDSYNRAIELYPEMGDAYYNRGLVLIYIKDREKGCIDLSRAGSLGVEESYNVISKYCKPEENQ